jgi:hypothetical protein
MTEAVDDKVAAVVDYGAQYVIHQMASIIKIVQPMMRPGVK